MIDEFTPEFLAVRLARRLNGVHAIEASPRCSARHLLLNRE
jgi:hypothetical protein